MSIRPYQVVDGPAVAAIIRAAWPDDCPTYAASHQRIVEFEVDDSHVHLWAVLETLPVVGATHDLVVMADG